MDNPKLYAEALSKVQKGYDYIFDDIFPRLVWSTKEPEYIVDIGCGDGGLIIKRLLPKVPKGTKILGVDISKEMIEYASSEHGSKYGNLDFKSVDLLGNVDDVQQYLGCFSKVFSFYCLQWIDKQREAFECIYKILQPGGSILIAFPINHIFNDVLKNVAAMTRWKPYMTGSEYFKEPYSDYKNPTETLRKTLLEIGFEIIFCEAPTIQENYPNMEVVKDAMRAVNPLLHQIPEDLQDLFLDDHIQIFDSLYPGHGCIVKYDLMTMYCKKALNNQ